MTSLICAVVWQRFCDRIFFFLILNMCFTIWLPQQQSSSIKAGMTGMSQCLLWRPSYITTLHSLQLLYISYSLVTKLCRLVQNPLFSIVYLIQLCARSYKVFFRYDKNTIMNCFVCYFYIKCLLFLCTASKKKPRKTLRSYWERCRRC